MPTFAGQKQLSLEDVQVLADLLAAQGLTVESVPAGVHRGRKQYALANYTSSPVDFLEPEESNDGVIRAVSFSPNAKFPYIFDGEIVTPHAQDYYTERADGTLEESEVPGVLQRVEAREGLRRSVIVDGELRLAYANSEYYKDSSISVPGLMWGVEYDSSVTAPRLVEGLLKLPPGGGGGCPPAQYDGSGVSVPGSVQAITWGSSILAPRIDDGNIRLPTAHAESRSAMRMGAVEWLGWDPESFEDSSVLMSSAVEHPRITEGQAFIPPGVLGFREVSGQRVALRDCYTNGAQRTALAILNLTDNETRELCVDYRDGFLQFFFV